MAKGCFLWSVYLRTGWAHPVCCFYWIWELDGTPIRLSFEKNWQPDDPLHSVHKFPNRMRSPHYPSGLNFFFNFWKSDEQGIRFTIYTPDGTPPPLHPVLILRTGRISVRFSNFKKRKPNDLIRVPIQKFQKIHEIQKSYLFVVPCLQ